MWKKKGYSEILDRGKKKKIFRIFLNMRIPPVRKMDERIFSLYKAI